MQTPISDYSKEMQALVFELLKQHYGYEVELQLADSELQLDLPNEELTKCPTLFWTERGANFVVCRIGENAFCCQFFYSEAEQYGTGQDSYDDIGKCVITLLKLQEDHESQSAILSTANTSTTSIQTQ